jgi:hypothetical protein
MGIVAGATNLELILQSLSRPGNVWNPGIFADIYAQIRKEAAIADCMAVDAVQSKPLSRPNSLLSGKFTGIFGSFATRITCHESLYLPESRPFPASSSSLGLDKTGISCLDIRELYLSIWVN